MNSTIADNSGAIRDVDAGTFGTLVLHASGPVVVEFMSYGCVHCRALEPVIADVAESLAATEQFFRVNVAIDRELADSYGIAATPTLVFFRDGDELGRVEGPRPIAALIRRVVTQPFV